MCIRDSLEAQTALGDRGPGPAYALPTLRTHMRENTNSVQVVPGMRFLDFGVYAMLLSLSRGSRGTGR
eukprot:3467478-Rhodomonas_salina.1